jgi:hypothetical protein
LPLTVPLAGPVLDFNQQVSAPCRAHQRQAPNLDGSAFFVKIRACIQPKPSDYLTVFKNIGETRMFMSDKLFPYINSQLFLSVNLTLSTALLIQLSRIISSMPCCYLSINEQVNA